MNIAAILQAVDIANDNTFMKVATPTYLLVIVGVAISLGLMIYGYYIGGVHGVMIMMLIGAMITAVPMGMIRNFALSAAKKEFFEVYGVNIGSSSEESLWISDPLRMSYLDTENNFSMRFFTDQEGTKRSYYTMLIGDDYRPVKWDRKFLKWVPGPYPETVAKKNALSEKKELTSAPKSSTLNYSEGSGSSISGAELKEFIKDTAGYAELQQEVSEMKKRMDSLDSKLDSLIGSQ